MQTSGGSQGSLMIVTTRCDQQPEWLTAALGLRLGTTGQAAPMGRDGMNAANYDWLRLERLSFRPGQDYGFKFATAPAQANPGPDGQ